MAVLDPEVVRRGSDDDVDAVRFQVLEDVETVGKVEAGALLAADWDRRAGLEDDCHALNFGAE